MASTFLQIVKHLLSLLCLITHMSRSDCIQTSPTLPEAFVFVQSVYVSSSNTVYLFGTEDNCRLCKLKTSLYTWDLSGSSEWVHQGEMLSGAELYSHANAVALIDNLLYFVGANPSAVLIFDTNTNSWLDTSGIAKPPNRGTDGCVANNETHLFFVGGDYNDNGDTLQIYDIGHNTWSIEPIPMTEIAGNNYWAQMCLMHDNVLYVFGGSINARGTTANMYTWQRKTGWTVIGILPTATATGTAEKHALDDNIWIIGGWDGVHTKNTIYQFNIGTQTITNTYYMIRGFEGCSGNFIGNDLYTFGGHDIQSSDSVLDVTQVCRGLVQDVTSSTTTTTTAPTQLHTFSTDHPSNAPSSKPMYNSTDNINPSTMSTIAMYNITMTPSDIIGTEQNKLNDNKPSVNVFAVIVFILASCCLCTGVHLVAICVYSKKHNIQFVGMKLGNEVGDVDVDEDDVKCNVEQPGSGPKEVEEPQKQSQMDVELSEEREPNPPNLKVERNAIASTKQGTHDVAPRIVYNMNNASDEMVIGDDAETGTQTADAVWSDPVVYNMDNAGDAIVIGDDMDTTRR